MIQTEVLIVGAGAAGLMCAIEAGKRGRKVLVLESSNKPGKKILMSGGGRCNFTNLEIRPEAYLSHNPHFCKSALKRYTQWDFIDLVKKHNIAYHEKKLGQLFCDDKAKDILTMLLTECESAGSKILLDQHIRVVEKTETGYLVKTQNHSYKTESLVIASGGLSIPSLGSSPFGYKVAEQFGIPVWPLRAGLVPLTLHKEDLDRFSELSGVSQFCEVSSTSQSFSENILFTHRGLSGPVVLQISSYWEPGESIEIDFLPKTDLIEVWVQRRFQDPKCTLKHFLSEYFPVRLLQSLLPEALLKTHISEMSKAVMLEIMTRLKQFKLKPNATEGYRTAEVTLGGVDCDALSSQTLASKENPGLYFIGEVVDVTGWLGGYNFQWAWSSGWAAGQVA